MAVWWSQANKVAHFQKKRHCAPHCFTSSIPSNPLCLRCYSGRWRWRPGAPPPCVRRWCLSTQCHLSFQVRLSRGTWCVHYEFGDMLHLVFHVSPLLLLSFQVGQKKTSCYLLLSFFWFLSPHLSTMLLHGQLAHKSDVQVYIVNYMPGWFYE